MLLLVQFILCCILQPNTSKLSKGKLPATAAFHHNEHTWHQQPAALCGNMIVLVQQSPDMVQ